MWIVAYVVSGLAALSGIIMLFQRRYHTMTLIWLPLGAIGQAVALFSLRLLQPPEQWLGTYAGYTLAGVGLACSYVAKRRTNKQSGAKQSNGSTPG